MKILLILLALIGINCMSNADIETYGYTVESSTDGIEIRLYEAALFSSVKLPPGSYDEHANRGFRTLAGYIFGGNDKNESIAMTSPVMMELDSQMIMSFMVPRARSRASLPCPQDTSIYFTEKPVVRMAAIRFGGWANEQKIREFKSLLAKKLEAQGILHTGKFAYLGYNPPYRLINRRNEVVVELE